MHDSHKPPNGSPEQDLARAISAMVSEGIASARDAVDGVRDTGADALDATRRVTAHHLGGCRRARAFCKTF